MIRRGGHGRGHGRRPAPIPMGPIGRPRRVIARPRSPLVASPRYVVGGRRLSPRRVMWYATPGVIFIWVILSLFILVGIPLLIYFLEVKPNQDKQ